MMEFKKRARLSYDETMTALIESNNLDERKAEASKLRMYHATLCDLETPPPTKEMEEWWNEFQQGLYKVFECFFEQSIDSTYECIYEKYLDFTFNMRMKLLVAFKDHKPLMIASYIVFNYHDDVKHFNRLLHLMERLKKLSGYFKERYGFPELDLPILQFVEK